MMDRDRQIDINTGATLSYRTVDEQDQIETTLTHYYGLPTETVAWLEGKNAVM